MSLARRLRDETHAEHDAIEAAVDWQSRTLTLAGYRDLLARWHGYHAAREPHLRVALGDAVIDARSRLGDLARDLRALGLDDAAIAALPRPAEADRPLDAAAAHGALYVTEGATMGGQLIARGVRERHGPETPVAFFHPYGARTGAMWAGWRKTLDARAGDGDATVAEARRTFALLARWLAGEHP